MPIPSRSDTFGLVMLEAMACGTPVAAYRAEGPNAVVADNQGGCLHDDLREAFFGALAVPRSAARARALAFGWDHAAALFASHLVPVRAARPEMSSRMNCCTAAPSRLTSVRSCAGLGERLRNGASPACSVPELLKSASKQ